MLVEGRLKSICLRIFMHLRFSESEIDESLNMRRKGIPYAACRRGFVHCQSVEIGGIPREGI